MGISGDEEVDGERADAPDLEEWEPSSYHHNPLVREFRRLKALQSHHRRGYDFFKTSSEVYSNSSISVLF